MIVVIISLGLGLFLSVMTVFCIKGVDWILISGPNMVFLMDLLHFLLS